MKVREAVEEYRLACLHHSEWTQTFYMHKLKLFADFCEKENVALEQVRATHVRRYLETRRNQPSDRTGKNLASWTLHGDAQVIKTFLRWCANEDGLEDLVSDKTPRRIEMPKVEQTIIETFTPEHIKALFAACSKELTPFLVMRDKAILSLLFDTGIRATELNTLTFENLFLDGNDPFIRVVGKGRKEREVGVGKTARVAINRFITRFRQGAKKDEFVFLTRWRTPMTVNALDQLFYRLRDWAHIEGVRCSPHTARHTYAVRYLENGGDVYMLSRLMGHTSVKVTENYLKALKSKQARKVGISVLDSLK